ncbi:Ig-like domain-containing protein [Propionibacterium freudenreichii]|uniref:Ig-like domain-containing protein n=1 Tax=Propionibacterium freudenreichii TaxID=1744 RepID=UPI0012FD27F8|nr:hypothetical protein [Propionibacterium freudenreichii]
MKSIVASGVATALVVGGSIAGFATSAVADEGQSGCSYGQGGPKADALCWIDMSSFGNVTAAELADPANVGGISKDLTIKLGRYTMTTKATVKAGPDGASGVEAAALPTWGGSVLGSTQSGQGYYLGTKGKPAFYQPVAKPDVSKDFAQRDSVTLSDIKMYDNTEGKFVTDGYSLVIADAESTGPTHEGFTWTSDKPLNKYTEATPNGSNWIAPCSEKVTGLGSTSVVCAAANTEGKSNGILMVSADAPTTITSAFNNAAYASSRQGVAFALVFSTAVPGVDVTQNGGSNAEFTTTSSTGGSATSDGGQVRSNEPFLGKSDQTPTTYTVAKTGGDTPEGAYDLNWNCTINGAEATPVLSEDGKSATVNTPANGASSCVAELKAKGPKTGDDAKIINPNETATLAPGTTPGKGKITDVKFDSPAATDGGKTLVVPGEGTWKFEPVTDSNGQTSQKATFTPEPDYTGPVTKQPYTVTDQYGLTAAGTLNVSINQPPTAEPNVVTVNQGETANLTPTATKGTGDLKSATFDNGETTKVVPGEGTWKIALENGQPKATFTPDANFTGRVTQQKYTVTDVNCLTASSTLDVIIRPKTGPQSVTVDQGQTAELKDLNTVPGSGKITSVKFNDPAAIEDGKTLFIAGQGTWQIGLNKDGQPEANFRPIDGFTGPVTQQKYTVTDENGETATNTLDVIIRPATGDDSAVINPGQTANLIDLKTVPGSGDITGVKFNDPAATDDGKTLVVPGEGKWAIELVNGKPEAKFTPEDTFHGQATQQPYTVTDSNNETATGKLDVLVNTPPTTGDQKVVVGQGETASLTDLKTVPGNSDVVSAAFPDGTTEKVVPGEGTWKIVFENGQPKATFTPEANFTGPVTQQPYTVTDKNGLTATGKLDVIIKPATGDDSAVINPGQTANLIDLKTVHGSGDITGVKFNSDKATDGGKTLVVPGEGTWKITVDDKGVPTATFTPEPGYFGTVTDQPYTVTDTNGLTAEGNLSVFINVPPQAKPEHQTIKPGETATLHPETIPGTGPLTDVAFDNGQKTKHVEGQGTWKIWLEDGKVVSTFTPDDPNYTGPVTSQDYTVTDANGLKATSTLSVDITPDAAPATPADETSTDEPKLARTGLEARTGSEVGAWGLEVGALALLAAGAAGIVAARRKRS